MVYGRSGNLHMGFMMVIEVIVLLLRIITDLKLDIIVNISNYLIVTKTNIVRYDRFHFNLWFSLFDIPAHIRY